MYAWSNVLMTMHIETSCDPWACSRIDLWVMYRTDCDSNHVTCIPQCKFDMSCIQVHQPVLLHRLEYDKYNIDKITLARGVKKLVIGSNRTW